MPTTVNDPRRPLDFIAEVGRVGHLANRIVSLSIRTNFEVVDRDMRNAFLDHAYSEARVILAPLGADGSAVVVEPAADAPPERVALPKGDKSASQKLRGLLYRLWDATGATGEEFESFYQNRMRRIRQGVADEIEEAKR